MKIRASLLVTVLMIALMPVLAAEPASATTTMTARSILFKLAVKAESGNSTYSRTYFRHWIDANGDCQNTRAEVLIAESKVTPTYTSSHCTVAKGKWFSYYDGATWTNPADVDIDHLVALAEAWGSGARLWSVTNRTRYANDLGFSASLVAITDNVNQSKSAKDPAEWLPPRTAARCTYAIQWVQVKYRWRLSIDAAERTRLSSLLSGSCGSRITTVPARAI
jgi:hypothetical protein